MALFDEKHKAQLGQNSEVLRMRLAETVRKGPKSDGLFDQLSYNFSRNLLNDINTRKVKK